MRDFANVVQDTAPGSLTDLAGRARGSQARAVGMCSTGSVTITREPCGKPAQAWTLMTCPQSAQVWRPPVEKPRGKRLRYSIDA